MNRLGYVIANEREEFLHGFTDSPLACAIGWLGLPHRAKVYRTRQAALADASRLATSHRLWVLVLCETATQYAVIAEGEDRPPWIDVH